MIRTAAMAILLATSFTTHASEEAKAKADPAKGKVIAETVCVACHGADGNSPAATNPHLAGQVQEYIYKQLSNFKSKDGKPAERVNPIMGGMAAGLSDADMRNVAAYYASQTQTPATAKGNRESIELGQKIWRGGDQSKGLPACSGCHGPAGTGLPAMYPRVGGQHADYTESQLNGFRAGTRGNSAQMASIAARLSDKEIKAVSDYAAGLR